MGFLVLGGLILLPVALGGIYLWGARTWQPFGIFVALCLPAAAFARLAWVVLMVPDPNPTVGEFILPFGLLGVVLLGLLLAAYSKHPKTTGDVLATAGWAYLTHETVEAHQRKRDEERATALADELDRRHRAGG